MFGLVAQAIELGALMEPARAQVRDGFDERNVEGRERARQRFDRIKAEEVARRAHLERDVHGRSPTVRPASLHGNARYGLDDVCRDRALIVVDRMALAHDEAVRRFGCVVDVFDRVLGTAEARDRRSEVAAVDERP